MGNCFSSPKKSGGPGGGGVGLGPAAGLQIGPPQPNFNPGGNNGVVGAPTNILFQPQGRMRWLFFVLTLLLLLSARPPTFSSSLKVNIIFDVVVVVGMPTSLEVGTFGLWMLLLFLFVFDVVIAIAVVVGASTNILFQPQGRQIQAMLLTPRTRITTRTTTKKYHQHRPKQLDRPEPNQQ